MYTGVYTCRCCQYHVILFLSSCPARWTHIMRAPGAPRRPRGQQAAAVITPKFVLGFKYKIPILNSTSRFFLIVVSLLERNRYTRYAQTSNNSARMNYFVPTTHTTSPQQAACVALAAPRKRYSKKRALSGSFVYRFLSIHICNCSRQ